MNGRLLTTAQRGPVSEMTIASVKTAAHGAAIKVLGSE
jgi:hypothetical protein